VNELFRPGSDAAIDEHDLFREPSLENMHLQDAFRALNKLSLWNRLAFGRRMVRTLCSQLAGENPPVTSGVLIRQAVITVGDEGPHSYSALLPKTSADMPFLELLLRRMKGAGVQDVIVVANHLRHPIEKSFGDGSELGLRLYYRGEGKQLGSAGALSSMLDLLDETFFLTNEELLPTIDLRRMALTHFSERADASIGVCEREDRTDFGQIEFDSNKRLRAYKEKPAEKYYVGTGVYILQREALRDCVSDVGYLDVRDLVRAIQANNGSVVCFQDPSIWLDIGRPVDFARDRDAFLGHA
jgi:NDP-mannose synthase